MVEGQLEVCSSTHYAVRTSNSIYCSIQLREKTANKVWIAFRTVEEEVGPACLGLAPKVPTIAPSTAYYSNYSIRSYF